MWLRGRDISPWSTAVCAQATYGGHLEVCCGTRTSMAARGTRTSPAQTLLLSGIPKCYGTRASMAARGTRVHSAAPLLTEGMSRGAGGGHHHIDLARC